MRALTLRMSASWQATAMATQGQLNLRTWRATYTNRFPAESGSLPELESVRSLVWRNRKPSLHDRCGGWSGSTWLTLWERICRSGRIWWMGILLGERVAIRRQSLHDWRTLFGGVKMVFKESAVEPGSPHQAPGCRSVGPAFKYKAETHSATEPHRSAPSSLISHLLLLR